MPIKVQNNLPAKYILESENIFVMDENRAISQNIRPLKIVILNLMPLKEDTELDLLRVLSNFPIQTEISFMKVSTYKSTHTSSSHLNEFYVEFKDIEADYFDGLIITGAPVEKMEFSEVDYWEELCQIMDWSKTHVFSTFHICWGAQAGLYHHYGIQKVRLEKKLSGVYKHRILHRKKMLMRGMDDEFFVPQSRYTGSYLILACSSRQIFVTGHSEYDRYDLDKEYKRDLGKGLNPDIPVNYYPDNDPEKTPILSWRSGSNCIYSNWLNFVYQETPFVLEEMRPVGEDSYLREDHSSERDSTISSRRN